MSTEMEWGEITAQAEAIYDETVCRGVGCCGNLDGVLEYVQARVEAAIYARDLSIASLEGVINDLKAELEETKKHTTSATWKVFEENERLVALLADAQDQMAELAQAAYGGWPAKPTKAQRAQIQAILEGEDTT